MDVTQVLLAAQSPDLTVRTQAEQQIEQAEKSNMPLLASLLCAELSNEAKEQHVRQLAGVILKNCLTGKDEAIVKEKAKRWLETDPAGRNQIKAGVLQTLPSPVANARHTAAQVAAAIALIELPQNQWPELIGGLVANVTSSDNDHAKQSSLETLGFICEEIDPDEVKLDHNQILTAVVQGMRQEQRNVSVRIAATQAMLNALEFVKDNFEKQAERDYIMQTVCETTQAESTELKIAAYEVIVRVAELYYQKLPAYMQALFGLTSAVIQNAIKAHDEEQDQLGQQAIEFWTTVCDEESEIWEDQREGTHDPERPLHNFVKGAAPHVVPWMLQAMCLQDEDDDDESWNMAKGAANCLARISQTIEDDVVGLVMPFVQENMQNMQDWRRREAATLAFGSVLDGPDPKTLAPYIDAAIKVLLHQIATDQQILVKDTASWTIGRIFEFHIDMVTQEHLHSMLRPQQPNQGPESRGVLLRAIEDHPRVANNVAWAIHNLADRCEEQRDQPTNQLSALFVEIAKALLQCTDRPDASEAHLRTSSYEALNTLLMNGAADTIPHTKLILPMIIDRLGKTFAMQIVSGDDKEMQTELQGLLCGALQVMTQKLEGEAAPYCDQMMTLFLQVFSAKSSTVHEEALMAVGAVATATGADFGKYMEHFRPFLSLALGNYEEHQVCSVAVGVVGDICRALDNKFLQYSDETISLLLHNLQNPMLNRNVKPLILSAFGDIALAVGAHFEKYMQVTMTMMVQAAATTAGDGSNPDMVDYVTKLRVGILEAFTGILNGLRDGQRGAAFEPYAQHLLDFLRALASESTSQPLDEELLRTAAGVIGDFVHLGPRLKQAAKQPHYKDSLQHLLKLAAESPSSGDIAGWALQQLA